MKDPFNLTCILKSRPPYFVSLGRSVRNTISFIILFGWFFLNISSTIAADPFSLNFEHLNRNHGLSHNNVECILKDSDGFLWFGTRNGLCKYNGHEVNIYRSSNNGNSISGNRILCLNEDSNNNIWIGTFANGLSIYNKRLNKFTNYGISELGAERINKIVVLNDGEIWICTNNGLARFLPELNSFKVFRAKEGDPTTMNANSVSDFMQTGEGEFYVATEGDAIQKFIPETETFKQINYKRDKRLTGNYRKRIIQDKAGYLWIAAKQHGLCMYDPKTGNSKLFTTYNSGLPTNILMGDMALGPKGNIWIATDGAGIAIYNMRSNSFHSIQKMEGKQSSLATNHVYTLLFDNKDILWVGTFGQGINIYNPGRQKFKNKYLRGVRLDKFRNISITSMLLDTRNNIWIGSDGHGLYKINSKGTLDHYNSSNSEINCDVIISLAEDYMGNILIGTYACGLYMLSKASGKITNYRPAGDGDKQISSTDIWNMYASKSKVWLGLLGGGVDRFDPLEQTFENFGPSSKKLNSIDFPNVMAIARDKYGNMWFGTEGRGIYIFDSETKKVSTRSIDIIKGKGNKSIIKTLYIDKLGVLWIGTEGEGLISYSFDTKQFQQYSLEMGLADNTVHSIIEDNSGKLWIGTSNGLSCFERYNGEIHNFYKEDGLSGNEFNQNAIIQFPDGNIAIGGTEGLDVFLPEQITKESHIPDLVFTKLRIFNEEVVPGKPVGRRILLKESFQYTRQITLSHKEKIFSIEFAALNYTQPEKCSYRYILEGFNKEWMTTTSDRRFANYTNLEAGTYTFRVHASNSDGIWGDNEISLKIKVLPPFWETWYFRIAIGLLILAVFTLIYNHRLRLKENQFRRKQIEQEKKIVQLKNERLASELNKLTFHIINRNRVLIDQKNMLLGLSVKAKESVRGGLEKIIKNLDQELNEDKDWKYIEPQLDKVYNNFLSRLQERHKDLNLSEIKIAAYIRMNLSSKEISQLMHKTIRAVENDRYRLRKKIGLEQSESLTDYLVKL